MQAWWAGRKTNSRDRVSLSFMTATNSRFRRALAGRQVALLSWLIGALLLAACANAPVTRLPTQVVAPTVAQTVAEPTALPLEPSPGNGTIATEPPARSGYSAAGATPVPSPSLAAGGTTTAPAAPSAVGAFSGTRAWEKLNALAGIGPRPSGSPALRQGADWILEQLRSQGYPASLQPYSFTAFHERNVQMVMTQPETVQMVARSLIYSASGEASGPLVSAGLGRSSDYPSGNMADKIALVERGTITFQEKAATAAARGAAALVVYNNEQGDPRGNLARESSIPAVTVSQFDGHRLLELLKKGQVTVTLRVAGETESRPGWNVLSAPIPSGRNVVIIGAHYDSVPDGPGANDNASGVGTLLELATAVRGRQYPFDVVFIAFGDEDVGLVGSKKYVETLSASQRARIVAMINLDMVGVGRRMEFGGDPGLVSQAQSASRQMGYPTGELSSKLGNSSDHASFREAAVPVLFFYRSDDPNYHTSKDTADMATPINLEQAGDVALQLLSTLGR